jgi:hypothetical protein
MTSTTPPTERASERDAALSTPEARAWRPFIVLAAVLLFVGGGLVLVTGLGLLTGSELFTVETLPFVDDPVAWGWWLLLISAAKFAAGVGLLRRQAWGALLGIVFASLHLLAHMALLPAYPLASTLLIVLDTVVLWALVTHGWQDR